MRKLSARNQLKGKVVEVKKEAVDDLALAKGDDVLAVVKASDVMVAK